MRWSQNFASNLHVVLKGSVFLSALLFGMHLGAAAMAGLAALPWGLRLGLWAALGASLYRSVRRHGLRTAPTAIRELLLDRDGRLVLGEVSGRRWERVRLIARFVHPWLTILLARPEGRRRAVAVLIAFDAAEAGAFRRLRARLAQSDAAA